MKKNLLLFLACMISTQIMATNYYFSNSGDDNNPVNSESTPWKTIDKLNTIIFNPGDTIFFNRGDLFRGSIVVKQSGDNGNPIVFTSYGTGEKPIINGAEKLSDWTLSNGVYTTNYNQKITSLFIDNLEMNLARYPNDNQYLTLDSAQKQYLKDASITSLSADLFQNAKICIHTAQWCWEKTTISSVSGDQINFQTPTILAATAQYSYFVYGNLEHLDVEKEWYYDESSQKLYIKHTHDLNSKNCEVSVYTNGIELQPNVSYINIVDIEFQKQSNAGVAILSDTNTNILVDNCNFISQYNHGVNTKGINNEIKNSHFEKVNGIALFVNGGASDVEIHHNDFKDIGQFRNYGIGTEINLTAIKCAFVNNCYVHHNTIDGAGYCGISVDGEGHVVEKNIIKNVMLLNNDGGAIKSYGQVSKNIVIKNNFISTSDGNTEGTYKGNFITPAIYFDFNVNNCTIKDNTIYNRTQKGIFMNAGTNNNTITGNVIYGFNYGIDLNGNPLQPTPMTGMDISNNVFFAKNTSSYFVRMLDNTGGYNHGVIDNNYYYQPYTSSTFALTPPNTNFTYTQWQETTNYDLNSKTAFVTWSESENRETLFMNPTDEVVTIDLEGIKYLDLDQNEVCESLILQPYTSKILINSLNECQSLSTISNELNSSSLIIFPNPSSVEINIQFLSGKNQTYNIYNVLGQLVGNGFLTDGKSVHNISSFENGIYYLKLDDGSNAVKFVKN